MATTTHSTQDAIHTGAPMHQRPDDMTDRNRDTAATAAAASFLTADLMAMLAGGALAACAIAAITTGTATWLSALIVSIGAAIIAMIMPAAGAQSNSGTGLAAAIGSSAMFGTIAAAALTACFVAVLANWMSLWLAALIIGAAYALITAGLAAGLSNQRQTR